jgi:hypothetical protein
MPKASEASHPEVSVSVSEQAIEAAERALFAQGASVGGGGTAWWQSATVASETIVAAAVPALLNDLADRIEKQREHVDPGGGVAYGIDRAAGLVRAAAEGWNE